jgi:micrococcal nuclease
VTVTATEDASTAPASPSADNTVTPSEAQPAKTPRGVPAAAQVATVLSITDGDTLHVRAKRPGKVLRSTADVTVRLLEIDTPETVDPSEPVACYGPAASKALARLAPPGSKVWVLADQELLDPYDRTLLYLWTPGGTFINHAMVRNGFAKAVLYEPNDRYIGMMRRAEAQARARKRGLWGACPRFGAPLNAPGSTKSPQPSPPPTPAGNCDRPTQASAFRRIHRTWTAVKLSTPASTSKAPILMASTPTAMASAASPDRRKETGGHAPMSSVPNRARGAFATVSSCCRRNA